jgi:hypothetical protein
MSDEAKPVPLTKAEKLEAKAAKLREAEAERAANPASAASGKSLPWIVASGVLFVALVLTCTYAAIERGHTDKANELAGLRGSAIRTASTVATTFGSYDYQTLTADFARTKAYLTPSFASDYSKITASLGQLISSVHGHVVGTVVGVGATYVTATRAEVLVFLDQTVTSASSSTPRLDHNRIQLIMVRQHGKWLVSFLKLL